MQTPAGNELANALLKKLNYSPELNTIDVLSLPVKSCLFNTVKIKDTGDLGRLFLLFQIQILIWFFSLSCLISLRSEPKADPCTQLLMKLLERQRDSKIIKFHAVFEAEQKLFMLLRLSNWSILKLASLLVFGKL